VLETSKPRVWSRRDPYAPLEAVYIGRGTRWGNPHHVGWCTKCARHHTRDEAIALFCLELTPDLEAAARRYLRGKHLLCWCAPLPCHGDLWLAIANAD
jgi:hypothetical protein